MSKLDQTEAENKAVDRPVVQTLDLQDTRRALPIALLRAREALMEHYRPMLAAHDVTEQQWRVVRVLHENGETDAKTLARGACVLAPSLTRMLRALEIRGFIAARKDPQDKRRTLISLTPAGLAFLGSVAPQSAAITERIEARIGSARIERLLNEIEALLAALTSDSAEPD